MQLNVDIVNKFSFFLSYFPALFDIFFFRALQNNQIDTVPLNFLQSNTALTTL